MWILDKLEKYITIKLSISSMLEWYVLEALVHVDITTPYWIWLNYILNWRLTDLDFEVVWVKHVLRHVKLALATWVRIHWRPNLTCILSNKKYRLSHIPWDLRSLNCCWLWSLNWWQFQHLSLILEIYLKQYRYINNIKIS